jgi:hypothetical protein
MRVVLLVGCLSLCVCATVVTMRLRSLNQKPARFLPLSGNMQRYCSSGHLERSSKRIDDSAA